MRSDAQVLSELLSGRVTRQSGGPWGVQRCDPAAGDESHLETAGGGLVGVQPPGSAGEHDHPAQQTVALPIWATVQRLVQHLVQRLVDSLARRLEKPTGAMSRRSLWTRLPWT